VSARILAAATLWSTIGVASVWGRDYVWLAFLRSVVAAAAAAALGAPADRAGLVPGLLLGGLFSAYPAAALFAGVGPAAYLLYTAPLWTTTVLALWGEKPGRADLAGVALVVAAVVVVLLASLHGEISPIGVAAGLASGAFYGLYIATARRLAKVGREKAASLGAMTYTPLVTAPLALAYFAVFHKPPTPTAIAAGLYMGIFATLVPYVLFTSAMGRVGGARASVIASIEPVLAAVWGALLFGQIPGVYTLVAYGLITAATLLALSNK